MIRVVQTHTVGFERPFLFRLGTLLPDPTILGKPDFRSRTSEAGLWSGAGLTRNWAISQFVSKVHGPIPWTNPFTIRPFPGGLTLLLGRRTPSDSLWLTRNYPNSGYHSECSTKYTVLYLELIRALLDPFQASHTIIGTSDSFRLPRTHSELPQLGLSLGMLHKVHGPVPWTNPFTIRSFSGVPHYYWDVGLL